MPKIAGPVTMRESMSLRAGRWNASAKTGRCRFSTSRKPTNAVATAPIITNARLGSHAPVRMAARSRKFSTFAGLDMPEITSPRPKISPMANWIKIDMADLTADAGR